MAFVIVHSTTTPDEATRDCSAAAPFTDEVESVCDMLLQSLNCASMQDFARSITSVSLQFDYRLVLLRERYCSVAGMWEFKHIKSGQRATLTVLSKKTLTKSTSSLLSITTVDNILWQTEPQMLGEFLQTLADQDLIAKEMTHRRDGRHYNVVRMASITSMLTPALRKVLIANGCHLNMNVSLHGQTHRCLLIMHGL